MSTYTCKTIFPKSYKDTKPPRGMKWVDVKKGVSLKTDPRGMYEFESWYFGKIKLDIPKNKLKEIEKIEREEKTQKFGYPIKADGSRDMRYTEKCYLKKDGTCDYRYRKER
jgi:hypothetical protein